MTRSTCPSCHLNVQQSPTSKPWRGMHSPTSGAESYTGVSTPLDPKKENAVNAVIGIGSAALTYAGWPLLTRFNRWADDKLGSWGVKNPPLVSAAV